MSQESLRDIVMIAILFVFSALFFYVVFELVQRHRKNEVQREMRGRLLEKFASAQELIEFLQSPGSAQLMNTISAEDHAPARDILRAIQRGILLLLVGMACLFLHFHYYQDRDNPLLAFAVILSALGIAFLISAAVSNRLAKTLGLIKQTRNPQQ